MTPQEKKSFGELADFFRILGNDIRLKILALCSVRERSSRELREILGISKPLLIAHLRKLLRTGLLSYRVEVDEGKGVLRKYYKTSEFRIIVSHELLRELCRNNLVNACMD